MLDLFCTSILMQYGLAKKYQAIHSILFYLPEMGIEALELSPRFCLMVFDGGLPATQMSIS